MNLNCRFYKKEYPDSNEVIMAKISDENDLGFHVSLVEYNLKGFLPKTELIKGRTRKKKIVKIGQMFPVSVTAIEKSNNHINVSKKRVHPKDAKLIGETYKLCEELNKLGKEIFCLHKKFCNDKKMDAMHNVETIMTQTIWSMCPTKEDSCKIYKEIIKNPATLIENLEFYDDFKDDFKDLVKNNYENRIVTKNMILDTDVNILVLEEDGVECIKKILDIQLDDEYDDFKLSILMTSPPTYKIRIEGPCERIGKLLTDKLLNQIEKNIKNYKAQFNICHKHKIVRESESSIKFLSEYEINEMLNLNNNGNSDNSDNNNDNDNKQIIITTNI